MSHRMLLVCAMATGLIACHGATKPATVTPPDLALSGLVAQRIVVLPTYTLRVAPELLASGAIGKSRDVMQAFDADVLAALDERGLRKKWVFTPELEQSYKRNSTYATDPHALGEEPLRSDGLETGTRLPEPLASQLRTMVALTDDARFVLAPVELRLERLGSGYIRPALRLALLDARASEVRWVGDVKGDSAATFGPSVTANLATKMADLIATQ